MKGTGEWSRTVWTIAAVSGLAGVGLLALAPAADAEAQTYVVGGVGFLSVAGDADAAVERDVGLNVVGGIRRRVTDRITVGVSGEYGTATLNEREFFDARDIFPTEPERYVTGGDLTLFGGSVDGLYEYEVDRGTIVYGTLGAGYYSWSVDAIFVNVEALGIEDRVDAQILFEDESGFGGHAGVGVRFPIGESAGLWAELVVEMLSGASGGSMQLVPLRAGISLP